ncbi:MAG: glyoxylate/hydroxypyruvate reductase A [Amphritea sp.]
MRPLIPFVHQIDTQEANVWLAALEILLPHCDIRLFSQLSEQERAQASIAIVANPRPDELTQLPSLKWVHSVWAGVERMVAELSELPFDIVRLVDPNLAETMSEAVLAWVMYLHRDMPRYKAQQATATWQPRPYIEPVERRIAFLGLGELGQKSAQRLRQNGFSVSGWSRSLKNMDAIQCYAGEPGLTELLAQADIIVNLLPLTQDTKGLLNSDFFKQLKSGACVINFGRGATIIEADLIAALDAGQVSHAVLDVFEQEPLETSSELWSHPGITLLPHISAQTSIESASRIVASNIDNYLDNGLMPQVVDKKRGY